MTNMNKLEKYGGLYSKWYNLILWILGISLLIGLIFNFFMGNEFSFYNVLMPSLFNTACLWLGSMSIVIFVWSRFPWESMPLKHLLVETLMIVAFLTVFILGVDMFFCFKKGTTLAEGIRLNLTSILFTVMITFLIVTIHEAIFFYRQWKLNFSKSVKLEKDNLEASYNALKSQVNPHFLFNSLNSLMSLLENNPTAEQYVQDLSDFLRYVLMSNDREVVTLEEELENLQKYIHLQKLRFQENLQVEIQVQPASLQYNLPPLTLQILLENCIKHNVISAKKPLKIRIFDSGENILVVNNRQPKQAEESTGHGLKNIEGRYRFISGEPIKIESDEKQFSVTVPLINK